MNKIVHLTSVHPPFDVRIFYKECKSLASAGYEVVLVAPHENVENLDGVRIRPIPKYSSRIGRMTKSVLTVCLIAFEENADVYHLHDPELLFVGFVLRLFGKRVVYDVHENVPCQVKSKQWIPALLRPPIAWGVALLECFCGLSFSGIVAATPIIAERFPDKKTVSVCNFPLLEEATIGSVLPYLERPEHVAYIGGISAIRGIREMVDAMGAVSAPSTSLVLAGSFEDPLLEEEVRRLKGWQKVDFVGWQDRKQIVTLLGSARVGLVTLHPTENYFDAYPVKMFEYMSAGIPIVASDFPLWREIVEESNCGILVDPHNPQAIADAITKLIDNPVSANKMGESGRATILSKYNWNNEKQKLFKLYTSILSN